MKKKFRIKKNDIVMIISGDEKGKKGKVLSVFPDENRLIVEGVNFVRRHTRQRSAMEPGGILEKEAPVHISNVMLVCPKCGEPTRVGRTKLPDGGWVRYCKHCQEIID